MPCEYPASVHIMWVTLVATLPTVLDPVEVPGMCMWGHPVRVKTLHRVGKREHTHLVPVEDLGKVLDRNPAQLFHLVHGQSHTVCSGQDLGKVLC